LVARHRLRGVKLSTPQSTVAAASLRPCLANPRSNSRMSVLRDPTDRGTSNAHPTCVLHRRALVRGRVRRFGYSLRAGRRRLGRSTRGLVRRPERGLYDEEPCAYAPEQLARSASLRL